MFVSQTMVAEAEIIRKQNLPTVLDVKFQVDVKSPTSPTFHEVRVAESVSTEIEPFGSVVSCSEIAEDAFVSSSATEFIPTMRSGSYADIGPRRSMDDEHICVDDLSSHLGPLSGVLMPTAFYAVFDGHGGPEAAVYFKKNVLRLFFEDAKFPGGSVVDAVFFKEVENIHRRAFLLADLAMADEAIVSSSCGTTALTALVLGRHLLVANAGDCRAVLCRDGVAVDMSQVHRPSFLPERERVVASGGFIDDEDYLNGCLSVTRALGDWEMKLPVGSASPLISDPDVRQTVLTEKDEFLILGCDGIWDVMTSQYAVSLVRRGLRRHDDPQQSASELVREASLMNSADNLTAIVVCFSSPKPYLPRQRRFRFSTLSEETRAKLKSLIEDS